MDFEWHQPKSDANRRDRGFGFDYAVLIFAGPTVEALDTRQDYGEVRVQAIGAIGGTVLTVIYTDRDGIRRIISARPANKRERMQWHERA